MKRRADGRYRRIVNGVEFYGKSEREVNRKILEYREKKEKGRPFREVADDWWREAYDELSPTSIHGYVVAHRRAVEYFSKKSISDITSREVSAYLQHLGKLGFAKSTVKNHKIVLNRIFHYALLSGDIQFIPSHGVEVPRGLKETRRKAATIEDEDKIRQTADVWLMPYMALMSGLRRRAACPSMARY